MTGLLCIAAMQVATKTTSSLALVHFLNLRNVPMPCRQCTYCSLQVCKPAVHRPLAVTLSEEGLTDSACGNGLALCEGIMTLGVP